MKRIKINKKFDKKSMSTDCVYGKYVYWIRVYTGAVSAAVHRRLSRIDGAE